MQTKPLSYLSAFCGVLLLAGSPAEAQDCTSPPRNAQNVAVEVVDDTPSFINRFCTGPGSRNGDLCNAAGARPEMVFRLQGAGAATWAFVRMELSADGSNWSSPNLPAGAYDDLGFSSDPSDPDRVRGWPPVSLSGNGRQMTVQNDNCHAFEVHYRLLLRSDDGREVYLHPRLENGGIGG